MQDSVNKFLALILSVGMILTFNGCVFGKRNKTDDKPTPAPTPSIEDTMPEPSTIPSETPSESFQPTEEMSQISPELDSIRLKYIDVLDDVFIAYDHIDHYPDDIEIDNIQAAIVDDSKCPYEINSNLDIAIEELYSGIKKKSLGDKDKWEYIVNYRDGWQEIIDNTDMDKIIKKALRNIFANATNDINEDFCRLKDAKISFLYDQFDPTILGFYEEDTNTIYICYLNIIDFVIQKNPENPIEYFEETLLSTIEHEINHVRQKRCEHRKTENVESINYMEYFEDGTSCLVEASAESVLYNQNVDQNREEKTTYDYTYSSERENEALLFLLAITNTSIDDYYNAIYNSDLESLQRFFHLTNDEDIHSFYRVLYALDSLSYRTHLPSTITGKTSMTTAELKELVGLDYRVDLFKLIVKNLMLYTCNNSDFTIEENINLYYIVRQYIVNNIYFLKEIDGEYEHIYDSDLVEKVIIIDGAYKDFLMEVYHVSKEEISKIEKENYSFEASMVATDKYMEYGEVDKAKKLVKRFPLLKQVFFSSYAFTDAYDTFLEDNGYSLEIQPVN